MKKAKWYALYKGDEFLTVGSKQELAKYLNVKETTINFYKSKVYRNRNKRGNCYIVIRVED